MLIQTINAAHSAAPQLVTEQPFELPVQELLLHHIEGILVVDIDIDEHGRVKKCTVVQGLDPVLDSIVCISMRNALFTPAYEEGFAVPATVTLSYTFDSKTIIRNSGDAVPELHGTVFDGIHTLPIHNATIRLEYIDASGTNDSGGTVSRIDYLHQIAQAPGQGIDDNNILYTVTDSAGRFAFRLLPNGQVRIAIIASGYEITHYQLQVAAGTTRRITCHMRPIIPDTGLEITVFGTPLYQSKVNIEEEQITTGLTHCLSDILLTKTAVHTVPESKSIMMVRAGSPFDNRYYLCGVPFLAPFHFGGHVYADIDGLMISALNDIDITIDRIAGRQLDASGLRINAQPGIYRPANRSLLKRAELSLDYSTRGQDFLLSFPSKKNNNCLQLGFTHGDWVSLALFNARNIYSENEYGDPLNFNNITLTGIASVRGCSITSFSWLAWSTYRTPDSFNDFFPWGMSSVSLAPSKWINTTLNLGGSHQYFASGKQAGTTRYRKTVYLTNGVASCTIDSIIPCIADASIELFTDYTTWHGTIGKTVTSYLDSTRVRSGVYYYKTHDTSFINLVTAGSDEFTVQLHGTLGKTMGEFSVNLDLLAAGIIHNGAPSGTGDVGVALGWQGDRIQAGLNGGTNTTRPDIRGLPDSTYRQKLLRSYLLSAPLYLHLHRNIRCSLQPYLRYKPHEPYLDPVVQQWSPGEATGLLAAGIDGSADIRITDWLSIDNKVNRSRARRYNKGTLLAYEWDIPWTIRSIAHFHFGEDPELHLYFKGFAAKGMPFYDFIKYGHFRAPDYHRFDISMQYRSKFIRHRFLTRYDAYFNLFNCTDHYNASDYYWNRDMEIVAIPHGYMVAEMGAKISFRL